MSTFSLLQVGDLQALHDQARADIATVHRRPPVLRRGEVIAAESALRGARLSARIEQRELGKTDLRVYGLLAPNSVEAAARVALREPAHALARLSVLAGGQATPAPGAAERARQLSRTIAQSELEPLLLCAVAYGEIAGRQLCGQHSAVVARVFMRLLARANGADPAGICVPEVWFSRHRTEVHGLAKSYAQDPIPLLEGVLCAWSAGAAEAESIVAAC
ncbi:hypothetical protein [Corynebacterium tapiri]|uniref:Oxidoreductase n=1 Tax=Corynebacterium tapiri TaxID=1448266 RepID=A0A5C4U4H2_9CORY|nr:hypothetical protein [Corynebacterium tapiri]TNL97352.1 hypothetical protein FHE74_06700 [Corynebacterium tapiri]